MRSRTRTAHPHYTSCGGFRCPIANPSLPWSQQSGTPNDGVCLARKITSFLVPARVFQTVFPPEAAGLAARFWICDSETRIVSLKPLNGPDKLRFSHPPRINPPLLCDDLDLLQFHMFLPIRLRSPPFFLPVVVLNMS